MQLKFYRALNTNWVPDGFHFHESGDEVRTQLVSRDLDHAFHVACRGFLDCFDFVGAASRRVDGVDVHVRREPWQQLLSLAADDVHDPGRYVARGEDLGKG